VKVQGRAREWALGHADNGTEQIGILFDYSDENGEPNKITYYGYFTESTADRTIESMRYCGWEGDDFGQLDGLDRNEVELVIEDETYQGKTRRKIQWVNRLASVALKRPMDAQQIAAFAAKMRGRAVASRQKMAGSSAGARTQRQPARAAGGPDMSAPPPGDDDIPF